MKQPLVSIAIITYNQERYIGQAIESVLMQKTNFEYEIIIGEDKSSDKTRQILLDYQRRYPGIIKLILRDENVGASFNYFDVIQKCEGEFVTLLEGDDYWISENKLQVQVDYLLKHHEVIGVSHCIEGRNEEGILIGIYPEKKLRGSIININQYLRGCHFPMTATMIRNIYKKQNSDLNLLYATNRMVTDLTSCILWLDKGEIYIIDKEMAVYRARSSNKETNYNSSNTWLQKYNDSIKLIKANEKFYKGKYSFTYLYAVNTALPFVRSIISMKFETFLVTFNEIPKEEKNKMWYILPPIILVKIAKTIRDLIIYSRHFRNC
jgi:glycosyltransferase involved in cell wall biosynthesis